MGIYIKGMEMPKCCAECPINHDAECLICNNMVCNEPYTQKADWCPLVEVPPHGRLVDADALYAEWLDEGENECIYDTNAFLYSISGMPTIIEEEI